MPEEDVEKIQPRLPIPGDMPITGQIIFRPGNPQLTPHARGNGIITGASAILMFFGIVAVHKGIPHNFVPEHQHTIVGSPLNDDMSNFAILTGSDHTSDVSATTKPRTPGQILTLPIWRI